MIDIEQNQNAISDRSDIMGLNVIYYSIIQRTKRNKN